jgi:putative ABC transport system permease protein
MKLMIIALSNMRKHISSIVVTSILIAVAVLLLYSSVNTIISVTGYADSVNKKQNAADVIMLTNYSDKERIDSFMKEQKEITEYESRKLYAAGIRYRNISQDTKWDKLEFRFLNMNEETTLSNFIIYDKGETLKDNSIILPMYMKTSFGYKTGDTIELEYATNTCEYEVYGFIEDVMFPNPNTVTLFECMLPQKAFEELKEYGCIPANGYYMKISDGMYPSKYSIEFKKNITEQVPALTSATMLYINDSQSMCYAASVWAYTIMALFALFALLIIVIAIIVVRFSIITTIEDNLPNIGILEAGGYTARQMIFANIVEFLVATGIGILIGFAGAIGARRLLEGVIQSVTGLLWKEVMNVNIALTCIVVVILVIVWTTYAASRRIKKITPLEALRSGINSHNFKKNHISLEKSHFSLNVSIGLKNIINNLKQNISICIIVGMLTFICAVFFNVYYNMVIDQDGIIKLVGIEKCDIIYEGIDTTQSDYKQISNDLCEIKGIRAVTARGNGSFNITNGEQVSQVDITSYEDFGNLNINTLIKGRYPEKSNEIVLATRSINELKAELGDVVYAEYQDKRLEYVVVGIEQHLYNVGKGGMMSFEGIKRLDEDMEVNTLYIYTQENADVKDMVHTIKERYHDEQSNITDCDEYFATILSTFSSAIKGMSLFSLVATLIIVCLIIYLLIKIKLLRDRSMIGVYKALGFVTSQLVSQTVLSYMPVIATGTILGGIFAVFFGNPIVAASFRIISGIEKCDFTTMYGYIALVIAIIIAVALIISILCSIKIRKIEPCKMIQEK